MISQIPNIVTVIEDHLEKCLVVRTHIVRRNGSILSVFWKRISQEMENGFVMTA